MDERRRTERFEQLIAWQKARALARSVYEATAALVQKDRSFGDQTRRAAASISANIAEGFERGGLREFRQFLSIAKGWCAELRTHLYIAADVGYLDPATADLLVGRAEEEGRIIAGLRRSIAPDRHRRTFRRASSPA